MVSQTLEGAKRLTRRQWTILTWIKSYARKNGYPPTRQEIADHFEIQHNAVTTHLYCIEKKGAIRVIPHTSRGLVFP